MNALVTGGAGFIGSNLVAKLLRTGSRVKVLDNLLSGYECNLEACKEAVLIRGDVRSKEDVEQAVDGVDVVFHLAASVGNKRSIDDPWRDAEINVMGTIQLLEAARRAGVRKFVVSSSAGTYGELQTMPIRESHPQEPDTPYGVSKLCQEKDCLVYAKLYGMEAICLRYFNVYGPNQRFDAYGNVIPIFVFQALRGEPLTIYGDGEQTRDFVSVHDVVSANVRAAEVHGVSGAFNIASGTRISINALVEMLRSAGLEFDVAHGHPRAGDVRDSLADIGAAKLAFGYQPAIPIQEGLAEYVRWARAEAAV